MLELVFECHNEEEQPIQCRVVILSELFGVIVVEPYIFYQDAERLANALVERYQLEAERLIWLEYQGGEIEGALSGEFRLTNFHYNGHKLIFDGWPQTSQKLVIALLETILEKEATSASQSEVATLPTTISPTSERREPV